MSFALLILVYYFERGVSSFIIQHQFTKSKSIFPTDDAIRKVVYMSVSEISKKWTMPVRDWGLAYAQFMIYFEDRFAA